MKTLNDNELRLIDAYFRAANYLAVGQLYLLDNPLLRRPLEQRDIKHKIVGHWGTVPGQNFIYTHLNRIIKKYDSVLEACANLLLEKEKITREEFEQLFDGMEVSEA